MQIALRRGVSNALGREWGVYYEPWGGDPFSTYNFMENGENEWYITNENFGFHFYENGGSSMSLAKRLFYYSLSYMMIAQINLTKNMSLLLISADE